MKRNVGYYGFEIALSIGFVEKGSFAGRGSYLVALVTVHRSTAFHKCSRVRCCHALRRRWARGAHRLEPLAQCRSNLSLRDNGSSHSGGRPRIGIPARKGETWWCASGATPRRGRDRGITSSSHHINPPTQCPLGFHCRTLLKDFIEITVLRSTCEWLLFRISLKLHSELIHSHRIP